MSRLSTIYNHLKSLIQPIIVPLSALHRRTFRQHAVEQLRSAILDGDFAPGDPLNETALAARFGISRGPLREALRQLADEGLLTTVPYTGTWVTKLSAADIQEIQTYRAALETFAFELVWPRRDLTFRQALRSRLATLLAAIDARQDHATIQAELDLHSLVYEVSGHALLQDAWRRLRGRLQLYWASHHRAHDSIGPQRHGHDAYVALALGDDFDALRNEIRQHMQRGLTQTLDFIRRQEPLADNAGSLPTPAPVPPDPASIPSR